MFGGMVLAGDFAIFNGIRATLLRNKCLSKVF